MTDDAALYRARAAAERQLADQSSLQNVRDRCERSALAWTAMAERSERVGGERRARESAAAARLVAASGDVAES